jgi:CheY-like chemotaxis protein
VTNQQENVLLPQGLQRQDDDVVKKATPQRSPHDEKQLVLPQPQQQRQLRTITGVRPKANDVSTSPPLTFLVVDDSAMNRRMLRRLLESRGHAVLEACDGLDCLRIVRASRMGDDDKNPTATADHAGSPPSKIDVILMDNNMPNMGGVEATRVLRSGGYTGVIFGVTGDVVDDDVATFMNSGATHVFPKPLDIKQLEERLAASTAAGTTVTLV